MRTPIPRRSKLCAGWQRCGAHDMSPVFCVCCFGCVPQALQLTSRLLVAWPTCITMDSSIVTSSLPTFSSATMARQRWPISAAPSTAVKLPRGLQSARRGMCLGAVAQHVPAIRFLQHTLDVEQEAWRRCLRDLRSWIARAWAGEKCCRVEVVSLLLNVEHVFNAAERGGPSSTASYAWGEGLVVVERGLPCCLLSPPPLRQAQSACTFFRSARIRLGCPTARNTVARQAEHLV